MCSHTNFEIVIITFWCVHIQLKSLLSELECDLESQHVLAFLEEFALSPFQDAMPSYSKFSKLKVKPSFYSKSMPHHHLSQVPLPLLLKETFLHKALINQSFNPKTHRLSQCATISFVSNFFHILWFPLSQSDSIRIITTTSQLSVRFSLSNRMTIISETRDG